MTDKIQTIIQIRVNLKDDLADNFFEIKKHIGIHNNSDIIRFLITEKYREIKKELGDSLDEHITQD